MDNGSNLMGFFRACIEDVDLSRMQLEVGTVVGFLGPLSKWLSLLLTTGETGIWSSNTTQSEPEFSSFQARNTKGIINRATG